MIYNYDEDKIKFFGMFGGRYLERKLDYDLKMKNKLVSNLEYYRYEIEKVYENIFPLFKFLFVLVSVGNLICRTTYCPSILEDSSFDAFTKPFSTYAYPL